MNAIVVSDSSDDEVVFFPVESAKSQPDDNDVIFCGVKPGSVKHSGSQDVEKKNYRLPPSVSKDVTIVSSVVRRQAEILVKSDSDDEVEFLGIRKHQAAPNPASFNININSQESLKNTNLTIDIEDDACFKKKVQLTFLGPGARNRSNSSSGNKTSAFSSSTSSTPRQKTSSSSDVARSITRNSAFNPIVSSIPKRNTPYNEVFPNTKKTPAINPDISRIPIQKNVSSLNHAQNKNVNPSNLPAKATSLSNVTAANQIARVPCSNNRSEPSTNYNYTKIHWGSISKAVSNIRNQPNNNRTSSTYKSSDTFTKNNQNRLTPLVEQNSAVKNDKIVSASTKIDDKPTVKLNEIIQDYGSVINLLKNLDGPKHLNKSVKVNVKNPEKNIGYSEHNITQEESLKHMTNSDETKRSPNSHDTKLVNQNDKEKTPSGPGPRKRNTSPLSDQCSEPIASTSGTSRNKSSLFSDQFSEPIASTSGISRNKSSLLSDQSSEPIASTSGISKKKPSPLPDQSSGSKSNRSGTKKRNWSPLSDQSSKPVKSTYGKSKRESSPVSSQASTNSSSDSEEESSKSSHGNSDSSSESSECEVPRPSMSKPALDTLFNKFLVNCTKVNNGLSVMRMKVKLKKFYESSNNITRNEEFIISLKEASIKVESKSIKNPLEIMKKVLVQLRRDSPSTQLNIKKLEKTLEEINKKIKQLEEAEVTSDEDENDNSYLKLDKYRKRAVEIYNKLCELNSVPADAERPTLRNVSFHGKVPSDLSKSITVQNLVNKVSRALERYHNKSRKFPDFHDVLILVQKLSIEGGSKLKNETLHQLARSLFEEFGDILQKRRLYDEYQICSEYLGDDDDPYFTDPVLAAKLDSNKKYQTKEKEILQKYTMKQATLKENVSDSASQSSSEEESDKDNAKSNKKKRQKSSDDWTNSANSCDEKKFTSTTKRKKKIKSRRDSHSRSSDEDMKKPRDKSSKNEAHEQKSFDGDGHRKNKKKRKRECRSSGSDADLKETDKMVKMNRDKKTVNDNEEMSIVNNSSIVSQNENVSAEKFTSKINQIQNPNSVDVIKEKNIENVKHMPESHENVIEVIENDDDVQVISEDCKILDHVNENTLVDAPNSSGLLITNVMSCQESFSIEGQIKEAVVVPIIDLLSDEDEEPKPSQRNVLTTEEILQIIPSVLNQSQSIEE